MKFKYVILLNPILLTVLSCNASSGINIQSLFKSKFFRVYDYDKTYVPSDYELSVVHFILKNTYEDNIHKMRGESKNVVYIKKTKDANGYSEAVFDEQGQPVTNSYNQASFNYYLYETEPIKHFGYDILPWLEMGNTREDPTTFKERMFHYSLDLSIGIQSYIFDGSIEHLGKINFDKLPNEEKMIYRFFCYIIFNKKYEIKLNEENKNRLKNESDYYWKYFKQIQIQLGVIE